MSLTMTMITHDSRIDRLPLYFNEKYNPAVETPNQYFKRLLSMKDPWCGFAKTPDTVKSEIWKRIVALTNRKYKVAREEERLVWIFENARVPYTKKSGEQTKMTATGIIMVPDLPTAYDLATGKECQFDQQRYRAGEITLSPPGTKAKVKSPSYQYFRFYSVRFHRFVSFDTAKRNEDLRG